MTSVLEAFHQFTNVPDKTFFQVHCFYYINEAYVMKINKSVSNL